MKLALGYFVLAFCLFTLIVIDGCKASERAQLAEGYRDALKHIEANAGSGEYAHVMDTVRDALKD